MSNPMDIEIRLMNDIPVFVLYGRFDAHSAPQVAERLDPYTTTEPARIIVNLEGVTFIDSNALGVLVKGMKRCRLQHGDLRVCGLRPTVRTIFELTRLDKAFALFADEQAAVAAAWS